MISFRINSETEAEPYILAKTVEVVVSLKKEGMTRIRIEALQRAGGWKGNPGTEFCTQAYREESSDSGSLGWVVYDLPWTDRPTADEAIQQAIGFLRPRCD
jgi:hypothetical protein